MKRFGFTLAEILITLSIVGVVAAMTIPSLTANMTNRKIGPTLAKSVSTYEQAAEAMLADKGVSAITDAYTSASSYAGGLSSYIKGSRSNSTITTKGEISYTISFDNSITMSPANPSTNKIGSVTIDINSSTPVDGENRFYFAMFDDGSLRPKGSKNWDESGSAVLWSSKCPNNSTPSDYTYCAGSIFENNLQVLYK